MRAKGAQEASTGILWLLGNHQKPLAAVTFHVPELPGAGRKDWGNALSLVCSWLEIRAMRTETNENH